MRPQQLSWDARLLQQALAALGTKGICLVATVVEQDQENDLKARLKQFHATIPAGIAAYLLTYRKFTHGQTGSLRVQVEVLLTRAGQEAS